MIFRVGVIVLCSIAFGELGSAQETETTINKSLIPAQASTLNKFVPRGWTIEKKDGKLTRVGVADKLLQCTRCGGAFYGVVESPANVKIEKGVIVVEQDHGSRDLTDTTYRFRYDPETQRFVLIGFDFADVDRLTGKDVAESTNYLTGVRKVTRGKASTSSTTPRKKIFIEDVDYEKFEEDAEKRLNL